mgnify:FL=1|jgi:uncharacterized protein involved in type VI secretion and phage assembly
MTYYGKFRGVVVDNKDPNQLGRLTARVPDVFGDETSGWALPATPYAGDGVGLYLIPPVGASVWIEFEHGDPEYPIWSGCFWASSEVPASPASPDVKVLKTTAGTITINDTSGSAGITIETADGKKIVMDSGGIEITVGQAVVKLSGPTVSVNSGALEVT